MDSAPPPRRLKVLQLCAVDFTLARFLTPLCFHLMDQGFDVTAACTETHFLEPLRLRGLRCVDFPIQRSMNPLAHLREFVRLSRWLKRERFDIVHVHTPIASLVGRFAASRRRVPITLYTAHGFYFHAGMASWKLALHIMLERVGALCHDYLFTQSEEDRLTAIRLGIGRPDRVRTIGNGVDLARFEPARFSPGDRARVLAELGVPPESRVLGIIGRLVREKGYFELFEATADLARRFPDLRVLVIGDALPSDHDDSTRELHARAKELGITDRLVLAGQRDDVPDLLAACDVFTLPSYREGMPRSIIEAMAMGLPVVATNIRGCREEVVEGETGFLVPPRDAAALADRCARLLADPALAKRLGEAGRLRAHQLFSEKSVLDRQMQIYRQLIREKGLG